MTPETTKRLIEASRECKAAIACAMRVISDLDTDPGGPFRGESYGKRFVTEMHLAGVADGFAVRLDAAIAKAEAELT